MTATAERATPRNGRPRAKARARAETPVLVRQLRNGIEESVHRGDIVEADVSGRLIRQLGDPDRVVTLRSTVKPFGVVALIEAGGLEEFDLEPAELAIMASSHSGEDFHVRTIQSVFRRAGVSQALLACGNEGMPLDALDRRSPGAGWREGQPDPPHVLGPARGHAAPVPAQGLGSRDVLGAPASGPGGLPQRGGSRLRHDPGAAPDRDRRLWRGDVRLPAATGRPGVRAAGGPGAVPAKDSRRSLAPALTLVRDAMLANPEMIGGRHDRLDTSLMKAAEGRVISKAGMEALRGMAILPGPRVDSNGTAASGMAVKIEDGDGYDRGTWAASIEALRQAGVLDTQALRALARYHKPTILDPHGRVGAESIADFQLAPVGELIG